MNDETLLSHESAACRLSVSTCVCACSLCEPCRCQTQTLLWTTQNMGAMVVLQSAFKGAVFGGVLYLAGDQASDMITYSRMHSQAMLLVEQDEHITQLIGMPYTSGAWYDATLAFSHRDKIAHCTFQLKGSKGVTDIAVKAGRQPGYKSNILYNLVGPSSWQLMSCQVMVPSEGGLVTPRSLMPEHQQQEQQSRAAAGCQPCQAQQQQSQEQQPVADRSSKQSQQSQSALAQQGSWWSRLWRRRQQQQQQQQQQAHTAADR